MDHPRAEKVAVVTEVREHFERSNAAILTEYRGLTVKDLAGLRRTLREVGGEYKIYKNTLVRFAAHDLGLGELESLLVGPTAIAFVDGDAAAVAKALRDYARVNPKLTVKGGVLGSKIMSVADATALADLPPRDVVLARLAGALASPMQTFAGLLQAVPRSFAYGLKALIEQRGAVEDALSTGTSAPVDGETSTSEAPEPVASTSPAAAEPEPAAAASVPDSATEPSGSATEVSEPAGSAAEPEPAAAAEAETVREPEPAAGASEAETVREPEPAAGAAEAETVREPEPAAGAAEAETAPESAQVPEPAESAVSATAPEPPESATQVSEPAESAVSATGEDDGAGAVDEGHTKTSAEATGPDRDSPPAS